MGVYQIMFRDFPGDVARVVVVGPVMRLEALGVLQKALHQLRPLHAAHVGGPVVDLGGGGQLPALGHAGDEHGVEVGTGGVDGGGVARRAGAEDEDFGVLGVRHGEVPVTCAPVGRWSRFQNRKYQPSACGKRLKSEFINTTSEVSIATSVPLPIAIPTWAKASEGLSFTPSPTNATI